MVDGVSCAGYLVVLYFININYHLSSRCTSYKCDRLDNKVFIRDMFQLLTRDKLFIWKFQQKR